MAAAVGPLMAAPSTTPIFGSTIIQIDISGGRDDSGIFWIIARRFWRFHF
jgi:hypothetical protein